METPPLNILGAGRAGTALARAAQSAGLPVRIAASRPPRALRLHLAQYAPRATAVPAEQIAAAADEPAGAGGCAETAGPRPLVVLMVPQEDLDTVDPEWVRGAVLVDATNRWADEPLPDWFQAALDAGRSSSEAVATRFGAATVVKAFNHISHWDLDTAGRVRDGGAPRRALAVAGDDAAAVGQVEALVRLLGFDPVALPGLAAGQALEPGGPVFNQPLSAQDLRRELGLTQT